MDYLGIESIIDGSVAIDTANMAKILSGAG